MPTLTRSCKGRHGRCGNMVTGPERYCKECAPVAMKQKAEKQSEYNKRRGSVSKMGYGKQWARARGMYLRENPLCFECQRQGMMVEAVEVHHVVPRRDAPERFYDPANLRGLCKSCHSRETARELRERHGGAWHGGEKSCL